MNPLNMFRLLAVIVLLSLFAMVAAGAQEIPTPPGMQKVFIQDPVLNMNAFEVFIPAKWHFQGTVIQGTSCKPVPSGVWRASSPDGLTVLEHLPRMDWRWGNGFAPGRRQSDCLPLQHTMSAQDFLKYMAGTLKVEYVSDDPLPDDIIAMVKKADDNATASNTARWRASGLGMPPSQKTDLARAIVRYENGSFTMKGLLQVSVLCMQGTSRMNPRAPLTPSGNCSADIRYEHAPEAQFQSALVLLDSHKTGAVALADWGQAWIAQNQRQTQANIAEIQRRGAINVANAVASGEQARHSMDVQQHMHQQFLSSMQRGTDMSMNRTAASMNARSTATSDWVDYSLDQQTVRDPNTGQVTKVSSSNSYKWLDSSGKTSFQTNDVNANPNGSLPGNWTRQTVVHGNGTN